MIGGTSKFLKFFELLEEVNEIVRSQFSNFLGLRRSLHMVIIILASLLGQHVARWVRPRWGEMLSARPRS